MFNLSNKKALKLLNFNILSSILVIPLASKSFVNMFSIRMSLLCNEKQSNLRF